jgi:hypothetical protein
MRCHVPCRPLQDFTARAFVEGVNDAAEVRRVWRIGATQLLKPMRREFIRRRSSESGDLVAANVMISPEGQLCAVLPLNARPASCRARNLASPVCIVQGRATVFPNLSRPRVAQRTDGRLRRYILRFPGSRHVAMKPQNVKRSVSIYDRRRWCSCDLSLEGER